MDVQAYLDRIDYRGSLVPTAETLCQLQVAHLLAVPFENLSIHASEPIVLEDDALFAKIVRRRRGGFCYEANGLFASLLRKLGFDVSMLSAQVADARGGFGPDFDHMTLLVRLDEPWLADVGFGDSFLEPLRLNRLADQAQGRRTYRIETRGSYRVLMQRIDDEPWAAQYRFTLQPYSLNDYAGMCHYHQTSPDSHFTQGRICSRATLDGRITLSETMLIVTCARGRDERSIGSREEYVGILREHFGIVLTEKGN